MMRSDKDKRDHKPRLAITHGDFNGIGYEVMLKALADTRIYDFCTPVIYGSSKLLNYHRKALELPEININTIKSAAKAVPKKLNLINCFEGECKVEIGESTEEAGKLSLLALEAAVNDLKDRTVNLLLTAPINKDNIQAENFSFPGHTEYLAERFGTRNSLMMMVSKDIRLAFVTGHVPVSGIPDLITKEKVSARMRMFLSSLKKDFGIRKPRLAVLSLNPHAGDNGLLGREDKEQILPAIRDAFEAGELVFGPFAGDGFFGSSQHKEYDGVLAMYHDQGMIGFKSIAFDKGVNYTAGLPIVRTSPAHGTAYEIAGKGIASAESFREAIFLALNIYNSRRIEKQISRDPLPVTQPESPNRNNKENQ